MKGIYIFIFAAIVFLRSASFGQSSTDRVVFETFNSSFLDSLVFEEVIQQRRANNLAKLFWSEEMKDTAEQHVTDMVDQSKLFYKNLRKGQCIVSFHLKNGSLTYRELSKQIVEKWLVSPGHKKLLLGEFFIYGTTAYRLIQAESGGLELKGVFYVSYEP